MGCRIWLLIRNMLLRLSVNMSISIFVFFIFLMPRSIALSFGLRMFWFPGSLSDM